MYTLTNDTFLMLMQTQTPDKNCVSIFMPTYRMTEDQIQNPTRFKNMLRQAQDQMVEAGIRTPDAVEILQPGYDLLDDHAFWNHPMDGLAAFLAKDVFHRFRVPIQLEERLVINSRFHVRPLLPLMHEARFYILSLSQNNIKLYQATQYTIQEMTLADIPTSRAEALWYVQRERELQRHGTGQAGIYSDYSQEYHKTDILEFFRQVDNGLHDLMHNENVPLLLAGVEYLHPIYREANTYPHLITDVGLHGNFDRTSPQEIHQKAWELVEPYFVKSHQEAVNEFYSYAHNDKSSTNLEEIVPAAYHGRVHTLLVGRGQHYWGSFDPSTFAVQIQKEQQAGSEDLLDLAATQTLLQGGRVFFMDADTIPEKAPAAAILRY